jgi:hypothetical protein
MMAQPLLRQSFVAFWLFWHRHHLHSQRSELGSSSGERLELVDEAEAWAEAEAETEAEAWLPQWPAPAREVRWTQSVAGGCRHAF